MNSMNSMNSMNNTYNWMRDNTPYHYSLLIEALAKQKFARRKIQRKMLEQARSK